MDLNNDVVTLKGVGPKLKKALNKIDIYTIKDLLTYFPKEYEITKDLNSLEINDGYYFVIDVVVSRIDKDFRSKSGKIVTTISFNTEKGKIYGKWFNQPYIKNNFVIGQSYKLYGKITEYNGSFVITNPKIINGENSNAAIVPKYGANKEITSSTILKLVRQVLDTIHIKENLPAEIIDKYKFSNLDDAIRNIHIPQDMNALNLSKQRLKFQELFVYSLKVLMVKQYNKMKSNGICFKIAKELTDLKESIPFSLTEAQNRTIREILVDEKGKYPMNRLVQGDVGSGKTIVALIAIFNVVKNGYQAAFMAPTEILASQHYIEASRYLEPFGIRVSLLTGSLSNKSKLRIKEELKSGEIDIIIGTHALIEDDVEFKRLGIVVTDEQHRFGVYQRAKLLNKGNNVDVLVMSATPIPRTLSLFLYGDLDISVIDELPPGRKNINTILVQKEKREKAFNLVLNEINKGRQAYMVCPLIEENEELDLKSVEELYKELKVNYFHNVEVGLLHGKLKASEKENIMNDFKAGKIKILISTTVIEVGVNVPNASVMVIENAERFGLSQLHQLRGRVGRGEYESFCVLIADIKGSTSKKRMDILVKSNDGFKISEEDMKIRGVGDIFGTRQHGEDGLILADIYEDMDILKAANYEAKLILTNEEKFKDIIEELKSSIDNSSKYICFN